MKLTKTLSNNNTLALDTANREHSTGSSSGITFRLVFAGHEQYHTGNRSVTLYPGHFLQLNEGVTYRREVRSPEPVTSFRISLTREFYDDFRQSERRSHRSLLDDPLDPGGRMFDLDMAIFPLEGDLKYTVTHLRRNLENGFTDDLLLNNYLHHYLINYHKVLDTEVVGRYERLDFLQKSTRVEILRRLLLAKDYIISNYHEKLTLEDICGVACLSKNHLLRSFKQAYHISPYQFLMQVRLERARYLLQTTDYSVNHVAAIVGFDCTSSFITFFRKCYQQTPARYRTGAKILRTAC